MKNRYAIAVYLSGMVVMSVGALFRIMHWPFASAFLIPAAALETIALLVIIAELPKSRNGQKFLDR